MNQDKISVISLPEISSNEESEEDKDPKVNNLCKNDTSRWNMLQIFTVLVVCIVFASPQTMIPRTNSIFYQTHWFEFNIVMAGLLLLRAGNDNLNITTYFKENVTSIFSDIVENVSAVHDNMDCAISDRLFDLVQVPRIQLAHT